MTSFSRRSFLRIAGSGLLVPSALTGWAPIRKAYAQEQVRYNGTFWLTIHASGGWDPTMVCDPKGRANETEVAPINTYFTDEILEVGNFLVPPIDGLEDFYTEFQNELLVINGIDIGTNGHEQGTRATWSGHTDPNRPAFSALVAGAVDEAPSLAFISHGGYDATVGVVPVTRLPNTSTLQELAFPDLLDSSDPDSHFLPPSVQDKVHAARQARLERIHSVSHLPRTLDSMQVLELVQSDNSELQSLVAAMPTELRDDDLERQIQIAMACFSAGVSVSANVSIGGFDTHNNHDATQTPPLLRVVQAMAFAKQEAERLGISDRFNVIVGSDFARTPYYNDGNGKDHWSIGSMMFMGSDIQGGRVIGGTDTDQLPFAVNPDTLEIDASGLILTPGHVHAALREVAGLNTHPIVTGFEVDQWLPLFG